MFPKKKRCAFETFALKNNSAMQSGGGMETYVTSPPPAHTATSSTYSADTMTIWVISYDNSRRIKLLILGNNQQIKKHEIDKLVIITNNSVFYFYR